MRQVSSGRLCVAPTSATKDSRISLMASRPGCPRTKGVKEIAVVIG